MDTAWRLTWGIPSSAVSTLPSCETSGRNPCDYATDHSAYDMDGISDDVCRHHAGSDLRRVCRAHEIQLDADLLVALAFVRILPNGAYGVGEGRAVQCRSRRFNARPLCGSGLCRRNRRAYQFRRLGAGMCIGDWQAARLWPGSHAAAQRCAFGNWGGVAVGRLVRIQRRQRPASQRPGQQRIYRHTFCGGGGDTWLDVC